MSVFKNCYEIMELPENASQEEIEKAYRAAAMAFHPDRQAADTPPRVKKMAEEKFKEISEAYEILRDPKKRKQFDEQLKQYKASQAGAQGGVVAPVLRVDRTHFRFSGTGNFPTEKLTIINDGGGVLVGTLIVNKPWVRLSDQVIDTPDFQEIEIAIDTTFLLPGFYDFATIDVYTGGGKANVDIDLFVAFQAGEFLKGLLARFAASFSGFLNNNYKVILAVLITMVVFSLVGFPGLLRENDPYFYQKPRSICSPPRVPAYEELAGNWCGKISGWDCYLFISSQTGYFEGDIFLFGIIGKIKGEIRANGEIVFKIESYRDVFADLAVRPAGFSEFLTSSFAGRLIEDKIESGGERQLSFARAGRFFNSCTAMNNLVSSVKDAERFPGLSVIYNLDFETAWDAALKTLEKGKEALDHQDKEQRIIITCFTEHSSLLGDYLHKYVIAFQEEMKTTRVIIRQFRYAKGLCRSDFSPGSDAARAADSFFFIPLEKELKKMTKKTRIVIQRQYSRKTFLSDQIDGILDLLSIPKILLLDHPSR